MFTLNLAFVRGIKGLWVATQFATIVVTDRQSSSRPEERSMRDMVGTFAILGGIIEFLAVLAGPQLAATGPASDQVGPSLDPLPMVIAYGAAVLAIAAGIFVLAGRNAQRWGLVMIGSAVVGTVVAESTAGFYAFGAVPVLLAGVLALFIRQRRRVPGR